MTNRPEFDAYSPAQVAHRVETIGVSKANMDLITTFFLAVLAGAFISFGALLYTFVIHDSSLSLGFTRLIGGLAFCLGLILVIVGGAELFTGNNLLTMAYISRCITLGKLIRNWCIVFVGNFVGAIATALLIAFSHYWQVNDGKVGAVVVEIANSKLNLEFFEAFVRGILCNVLVCLAVWLCFAGHSVTDKILAIVFPISAFVALGFEHSVANMYFIPAGMMAINDPVVTSALSPNINTDHFTVFHFLTHNLLPVTLGNIVGGGLLVGAVYWVIYLRAEH